MSDRDCRLFPHSLILFLLCFSGLTAQHTMDLSEEPDSVFVHSLSAPYVTGSLRNAQTSLHLNSTSPRHAIQPYQQTCVAYFCIPSELSPNPNPGESDRRRIPFVT